MKSMAASSSASGLLRVWKVALALPPGHATGKIPYPDFFANAMRNDLTEHPKPEVRGPGWLVAHHRSEASRRTVIMTTAR